MCAPGEGTLHSRFAGLDMRAKTGTLTGVCSLVGFVDIVTEGFDGDVGKLRPVTGPARRRILFAIVFNHYEGPATGVRPIQDKIVKRLAAIGSPRVHAGLPR